MSSSITWSSSSCNRGQFRRAPRRRRGAVGGSARRAVVGCRRGGSFPDAAASRLRRRPLVARDAASSARLSAFATAVATSSVKLAIWDSVFAGNGFGALRRGGDHAPQVPGHGDRAAHRRADPRAMRFLGDRPFCAGKARDPDRTPRFAGLGGRCLAPPGRSGYRRPVAPAPCSRLRRRSPFRRLHNAPCARDQRRTADRPLG